MKRSKMDMISIVTQTVKAEMMIIGLTVTKKKNTGKDMQMMGGKENMTQRTVLAQNTTSQTQSHHQNQANLSA